MDGLLVQRVHLHLADWKSVLNQGFCLPDVLDGGASTSYAAMPRASGICEDATARQLISACGLGYWCNLPRRYSTAFTEPNRLALAASEVGYELDRPDMDVHLRNAVTWVADAAAWWVGFFTVIRHLGVDHRTLSRTLPPVQERTLVEATRSVALGVAQRLLEFCVRSDHSPVLMQAYCRAVVKAIEAGSAVPHVIEGLRELRLVNLTANVSVWRGRFADYEAGTGTGQSE